METRPHGVKSPREYYQKQEKFDLAYIVLRIELGTIVDSENIVHTVNHAFRFNLSKVRISNNPTYQR